jgi:hypothetical protein
MSQGRQSRPRSEYPPILAIGTAQPILHTKRLTTIKMGEVDVQTAVEIFRVNAVSPTIAQLLL